jgi:hypothetical protein
MSVAVGTVLVVEPKEANAMNNAPTTAPWAQVLTLGDQRFGILVGGPFDGRCFPLTGTPHTLDVPALVDGAPRVRYVLRDGYYRHDQEATERSAA